MPQNARLVQLNGSYSGRATVLTGVLSIGRAANSGLQVDDSKVSNVHADISVDGQVWYLTDLQSRNGTFLDDAQLLPNTPSHIKNGSRIRIGDTEFRFEIGLVQILTPIPTRPSKTPGVKYISINHEEMLFGRSDYCDVIIDNPRVSRRHFRIIPTGDGHLLEDMGSTAGTFLNGDAISQRERLRSGDEIQAGPSRFVYRSDRLEHHDDTGKVRLDVKGLEKIVQKDGKPMRLLNNVHFVIQPKEFVAIVGASGAGKSTLLNALTGFKPATSGSIFINGVDFYSHLELFRSAIGYVPQEDIIHRELTVTQALQYAAELRLPPDTNAAEREKLIDQTLKELELSHRKTAVISTLSGGERKRVNVAVELLTKPSLLFLDEPTSGLDPGLERKFVQLVKRLTEEGRTILMVTHATSNMAACDKLLFMARGGRVAFFGPPDEALEFFETDDYTDIYLKVNDDSIEPDYWEQRYLSSEYYRRHIAEPTATAPLHQAGETMVKAKLIGATRKRASALLQFSILSRRYLDTFRGDARNACFLLAQAPIIAMLLMIVFPSNAFESINRNAHSFKEIFPAGRGNLLLFCMVISALLFGIVNAAREFTKEKDIYRRERLVNLRPFPYLLSKVVILTGICFVQSAILVGIIRLKIDYHTDNGNLLLFFCLIFFATICGMTLGLLVSSLATTNDQAMSLVPVAVLPQVIFSGLIEIEGISFLSKIMPSYWAFGALGNQSDMNHKLSTTKEFFDIGFFQGAISLSLISVAYGALSWFLLRRRD